MEVVLEQLESDCSSCDDADVKLAGLSQHDHDNDEDADVILAGLSQSLSKLVKLTLSPESKGLEKRFADILSSVLSKLLDEVEGER